MVRYARDEAGPPAQSRARATYESDVSVALLLSAFESAAAPAAPIALLSRLQERMVRYARGEAGPPAQARARATYESDVIELNAFASSSLFLPCRSS
jgi:hypothetical protein